MTKAREQPEHLLPGYIIFLTYIYHQASPLAFHVKSSICLSDQKVAGKDVVFKAGND
jgi:hypothetical protein